MYRPACLVIGYLIGCVQVAYILGRLKGIDIREYGSGNAGTTNVVRVLGPGAGLLVFVLDILKGVTAFVVCGVIFGGSGAWFTGTLDLLPGLYGGLGAILGHDFPVQLKGRGGKGSASTIGVILSMDLGIAALCYLAGIVTVFATRYISLASMIIVSVMVVLLAVFGYSAETVLIGFFLAGLSIYQHKGNIERLLNGNERKFNFKKQD